MELKPLCFAASLKSVCHCYAIYSPQKFGSLYEKRENGRRESPSSKREKIERMYGFLRLCYVTSTMPGVMNSDLSHNPILGPTCKRLETFFKEREGRRIREINGVSAQGKNCNMPSE